MQPTASGYNKSWMGIDPGAHGALVCFYEDKSDVTIIEFYKVSLRDIARAVAEIDNEYHTKAMMEKVSVSVGEDDTGRATRMFEFGKQYGRIEGIFASELINLEEIPPTTWQKGLGILPVKGETYSQRKRRFKVEAQKLFPAIKVTLPIADALLIAYYCKQLKTGALA